MSKNNRNNLSFSKQSDALIIENSWFKNLENSLVKDAVISKEKDVSLFDQINSIMNGKSKYISVAAAVEDMKERSGLTAYLQKIQKSSHKSDYQSTKTASNKEVSVDKRIPIVIHKVPQIKNTLQNFIKDTKGNSSIPSIIEKIKSIHKNDVADDTHWDDDKLVIFISKMNLSEKSQHLTHENHHHLGRQEYYDDSNIDQSNTDAFHGLMPYKL